MFVMGMSKDGPFVSYVSLSVFVLIPTFRRFVGFLVVCL